MTTLKELREQNAPYKIVGRYAPDARWETKYYFQKGPARRWFEGGFFFRDRCEYELFERQPDGSWLLIEKKELGA
jgi:hypothetical protein